jgi:hypothetical protein|tara:strand:+ start:2728 stop:3552 length:825 start_codon:yes stop_codon:yes gene_type:complete
MSTKTKQNKKSKSLEKNGNQNLPSFIPKGQGRGFVGIDTDDLELPRLKLVQSISEEKSEFEVDEGEFFHSVLEQGLGSELTIIPLIIQKAYILWSPRHEGRGVLARSNDGIHWIPPEGEFEVAPIKEMPKKKVVWVLAPTVAESGLAEFGSSVPDDISSRPAATKQYNILAYLPKHPEASPCVITLQRSGIKIGRRLITKLKIATANKGVDLYSVQLKMASAIDTNNEDQQYYTYKFETDGFVQDKGLYELCESIHKAYSKSGFSVKVDSEEGN